MMLMVVRNWGLAESADRGPRRRCAPRLRQSAVDRPQQTTNESAPVPPALDHSMPCAAQLRTQLPAPRRVSLVGARRCLPIERSGAAGADGCLRARAKPDEFGFRKLPAATPTLRPVRRPTSNGHGPILARAGSSWRHNRDNCGILPTHLRRSTLLAWD